MVDCLLVAVLLLFIIVVGLCHCWPSLSCHHRRSFALTLSLPLLSGWCCCHCYCCIVTVTITIASSPSGDAVAVRSMLSPSGQCCHHIAVALSLRHCRWGIVAEASLPRCRCRIHHHHHITAVTITIASPQSPSPRVITVGSMLSLSPCCCCIVAKASMLSLSLLPPRHCCCCRVIVAAAASSLLHRRFFAVASSPRRRCCSCHHHRVITAVTIIVTSLLPFLCHCRSIVGIIVCYCCHWSCCFRWLLS